MLSRRLCDRYALSSDAELPRGVHHPFLKATIMAESERDGCNDGFEPLTNCDLLSIDTEISSPNGEVIKQIHDGDRLKVALQLSGNSTVVVVKLQGQIAGEITSPEVRQLPEWIVRGTDYIATVTGKKNGIVRVRISPIE